MKRYRYLTCLLTLAGLTGLVGCSGNDAKSASFASGMITQTDGPAVVNLSPRVLRDAAANETGLYACVRNSYVDESLHPYDTNLATGCSDDQWASGPAGSAPIEPARLYVRPEWIPSNLVGQYSLALSHIKLVTTNSEGGVNYAINLFDADGQAVAPSVTGSMPTSAAPGPIELVVDLRNADNSLANATSISIQVLSNGVTTYHPPPFPGDPSFVQHRASVALLEAEVWGTLPALPGITVCSDGRIDENEQCDDGNAVAGDGCSNVCAIEDGFACVGHPSVCSPLPPPPPAPRCGDSRIDENEQCDDGNAVAGDGCSNVCAIEEGYACDGQPSVCIQVPPPPPPPPPAPRCGDSRIDAGEQCDDGNTDAVDGCTPWCAVENGWTCQGAPSVCGRTPAPVVVFTTDRAIQPSYTWGVVPDYGPVSSGAVITDVQTLQLPNLPGATAVDVCVSTQLTAPPAQIHFTPTQSPTQVVSLSGAVQLNESCGQNLGTWIRYSLDTKRTFAAGTYFVSVSSPATGITLVVDRSNPHTGGQARNVTLDGTLETADVLVRLVN
jgi:cysteine-rich repeat protein